VSALVTGAAGFIGSHLAERLLADGTDLLAVDRLSDYYDVRLKRANLDALESHPGFTFVEGDLNRLDLDPLLDGVDVVFHLAAQPGVRASWGTEFQIYLDDNVLATQRLLEAARERELRRFVFASSSSIYGDAERFPTRESDTPSPVSPYGVTKLAGEQLCRLYFKGWGVPTVVLRYFTIFGPRQRPDMAFNRFIGAALDGEAIEVFGDGLQERDCTYVGDAVAATAAAGERGVPGQVYNVAGGNSATVADVIAILGRLLEREPTVEHRPAVVGDARRTGADTGKAREHLGYSPRTSLEEGLNSQLSSERARRGAREVGGRRPG
jgi:nucleoside-diphosphate-sugar epimerase